MSTYVLVVVLIVNCFQLSLLRECSIIWEQGSETSEAKHTPLTNIVRVVVTCRAAAKSTVQLLILLLTVLTICCLIFRLYGEQMDGK